MATSSTTISCATAMTASARPRLRGRVVILFSSLDGWCWMREPKAKVLVDADETELETLVARKGRRRRFVVDDLGVDQGVVRPAVGHDAAAGRQHIPVPCGVVAKGPRHDEAVAQRAHPQGRGVRPPRRATTMVKDANDGVPSPPH